MASVVELDESNGAVETVTHLVTSLAFGTVDATGMTPGAPGARQAAGTNGMQKAVRLHMTGLGGGGGLTALRVFSDPSVAGWAYYTNAHATPATYATSQILVYVAPTNSTTPVPHALPVADPASPNLGIAGDLDASLTSVGWSDYLYLQLRAASPLASFGDPVFIAYDDIG